MQNEGNIEGKCNIGSPFSKAVMQRVMMKYGLCMWNRDYVESMLCMVIIEPSASGSAPGLPSGKEDRFAPLLSVPLRLSSDHCLFSRKSERQGRAPSFPFGFWFLVFRTRVPAFNATTFGIPLPRAGAASSLISCFLREGLRRRSGHDLCR